jgi:TPR repeat protein
VPVDKAEAVKWYRKAAEQGSEYAQNSLGECYYYGNGVGQNEAEAVEWFRKAAEQENEYAQNSLGECYYNGKGVGQNKAEAVMWSRKAAEQGNPDAQNRLGVCYQYGEGIDKDDTEAVKWYREAADQGNVKAQYNLALCFDQGIGVARNTRAAVTWYRRAAEQGDADAQNRLNALATRAAAPSTQETTLATTPAPVVAASQAPPARNPPNLRLTLRNLLAHMDGLLDTKDSQEIGKKLEGSKFGTDLFHEIREVMRRPSLPAPSITERGANLDCNTVAEYLDHELPGDRVPDFEDVIFKSEMRLAEVASCHQILTMALGEPAEIEPESRQRMYQLPDVAKGNNTVQLDHDNTKGK